MNKKLIWGIVIAVVVIGAIYVFRSLMYSRTDQNMIAPKGDIEKTTSDWKTYTNEKYGFSFQYPESLSMSIEDETVRLSSEDLSNLRISIKSGEVSPRYPDGNYSQGLLSGKFESMGSDIYSQTTYYFPISGDRTLLISIDDGNDKILFDQILSTFKFTSPTPAVISSPVQQAEKIQVYINVIDKDGKPFKPDKVEWYYPPVNGQATQYPAKCANIGCTRWSVTGVTTSKIYVVANYKVPSSPGAQCFSQAYDAKPVELSYVPAEITLTMNPSSYCY